MKMQDITEAGKFKNPFKGADTVSDASKASKAGTSALDDLKYVRDRILGKKEPSDFDNLPPKIEPTGDVLPVTSAPKGKSTSRAKTDASDSASAELDDIRKLSGVEFPKKTRTTAKKATAKPAETPAKAADAPTTEPVVSAPAVTPAAKSHEEMLADLQAELKQTQQAAERAKLQKQIETEKAALNPVAEPAVSTAPAKEPKTFADKANTLAGNLDAASNVMDPARKLVKGTATLGGTAALSAPLVTNLGSDSYAADVAKDYAGMAGYGKLWGPGSKGEKPAAQETPATATDNEPALTFGDDTGLDKPETKPMQNQSVDFKDLLKLAGLKPITERDVTSGLVKAKPIMTLVENTELNECGSMMTGMPSSNTPASLNISATASSGEEVANMLKSIMQLAGVKPVDDSMMPQVDALPVVGDEAMSMGKAMDIMTVDPTDELSFGDDDGIEVDVIDVAPDSMNDGDDVSVAQGDIDNDGDHDMADHEEEKKTEEGFESATTTPNPTAMPGYGSWEQKFQRLSSEDMGYVPPGSGNNPLKKESIEVKESAPVIDTATESLFKAYEAFKNGQ